MIHSTFTRVSFAAIAAASMMSVAPGVAMADMKIGVVNLNAVVQASPQLKTVQESLQKEFAPRQNDLAQQQQKLKGEVDKLKKDGDTMSEADKSKLQSEISQDQRDLERSGNAYKEDTNARQQEEIQKLQNALAAKVQAYGRSQNFDLIIVQGVVYANPALDITPQVIAAIKAE